MSVGKFLTGGGRAALAVAFIASTLPADASAQGRNRAERMSQEREGGDRADGGQRNAMEIRGERVQQANAARTQQAEQRAAERQAERRNEPTVAQSGGQRGWQGQRQSDRSGEQAARQVAQRGEQQARQAEQRTWQARQGERNRSYADQDRNRSYDGRSGGGRSDRRDNDRNGSWQGDRRDNDRNNTTWQSGRRDSDRNNRSWDRRWRNNDRYDWQRYRNSHRSVFYVGAYSAPYRYYSYRRYGIGSTLGSLFYGNRYWISNPWQYRLPDVWGPYRWVRYYDDVLLVDIYTGQVVDVIHNFFW